MRFLSAAFVAEYMRPLNGRPRFIARLPDSFGLIDATSNATEFICCDDVAVPAQRTRVKTLANKIVPALHKKCGVSHPLPPSAAVPLTRGTITSAKSAKVFSPS